MSDARIGKTISGAISRGAAGRLLVGLWGMLFLLRVAVAADRERPESYLDQLRALEAAQVAALGKVKPAFVFIGGGSGFCISPDGYILTNHHVIQGERKPLRVVFSGGAMYVADVVGQDPRGDVALLKVKDGKDLPSVKLGDSSKLRVGQRVVALGDPFLLGSQEIFLPRVPPDFEPSASAGIISALHRYSDTYSDAIQVDLAVNRGNSGGPLLTLDGVVVGINGKIETRFALGINTGVGYAIPSNQIRRFLRPLKEAQGGTVRHGTIRGLEVAERVRDKKGLPVTRVAEGTPAERAGFRPGDLILTIAGLPVKTETRYLGILSTYPAGEEVPVRVVRGEEIVDIAAVLVASGSPYLGISTVVPDGDVAGAEVTAVRRRSPARRAGLREGDVITSFDGDEVKSPTDLAGIIKTRQAGDLVVVKVVRGGKTIDVQLRIGSRRE
ncbi:MAG: trypsin-like peptidase domain-containing protein [Planctomycetota bacterium]|nr:trypsin-like peptidase domain-containing protein [Planctomycetota bacterium]